MVSILFESVFILCCVLIYYYNLFLIDSSVILYECNLRCKCHKQRCGNRVIQKGIKVKMELYRHKDMGWAVRARQAIPRGTFVCEYVYI